MIRDDLSTMLVDNLRAQDTLKVSVLRSLIGDLQTQEKAGKTAVIFDDEKMYGFLRAQLKQRQGSAQIYADAGAPDRAKAEADEAAFVQTLLPADQLPLTQDEMQAIVDSVVADFDGELTKRAMGILMKDINAEADGRGDGKVLSGMVNAYLT